MPNPVGAPPKLNPEVAETICAAIAEGCYLTVAGARVGILPYTIYLWNERGKREMHKRQDKRNNGEAADEPMTRYEEFYLMLEGAKAEARFSAETRVFKTMPLMWLKNGYARNDWRGMDHEFDQEDTLAERIRDAYQKQTEETKLMQKYAEGRKQGRAEARSEHLRSMRNAQAQEADERAREEYDRPHVQRVEREPEQPAGRAEPV